MADGLMVGNEVKDIRQLKSNWNEGLGLCEKRIMELRNIEENSLLWVSYS